MLGPILRGWGDFGPLVIRLALGAVFIGHGAQKLFGVWGGPGLQGVTGMLGTMGFQPPYLWALALALVEFVGGILVFVGLFTRYAALALAVDMAVAILRVHRGSFFLPEGMEFVLMLFAAAVSLALTGGRAVSIDRAARRD